MARGYKLNEIDEMDYFYYMDVLIYQMEQEENDEWTPTAFIDQI